jgi:hypothetical protein
MKTEQKPIIVKKSVRHDFTPPEIAGLNVDFRQSFANLKAVEAEFDNVKALWKSKTTEAESRMEVLNATLQAGFEMRQKDCVVVFRPADKKKDFYLLEGYSPDLSIEPVLTEDMTQADFEQDLIQAEAAFGDRVELILWQAGNGVGRMIVGSQGGKWFAAVRGNVGAIKIEERLDSEQMATKKRFDAITRADRRVNDWLKANLGKDTAKGFEAEIIEVIEGEKEKAE